MDAGVEAGSATSVCVEGTGLLESLIDGLMRWILRRHVFDRGSVLIYTQLRSRNRGHRSPGFTFLRSVGRRTNTIPADQMQPDS